MYVYFIQCIYIVVTISYPLGRAVTECAQNYALALGSGPVRPTDRPMRVAGFSVNADWSIDWSIAESSSALSLSMSVDRPVDH